MSAARRTGISSRALALALALSPPAAWAQDAGAPDAGEARVQALPAVDVDPRVLVGAVGEQTAANVAFDGASNTYLVTWRSALWRNELRLSRIDATGALVEARGIRLDGLERSDGAAAVVALAPSGGASRGFLVAWTRSNNELAVAPVPAQGPLALGPPVTIAAGDPESPPGSPALAAAGDGAVVVWSRSGSHPGVFARRLPAGDAAKAPAALALAETDGAVAVLGRGDGSSLVAFTQPAPDNSLAVRVVRLDAEGVLSIDTKAPVVNLVADRGGAMAFAEGAGFVNLAVAGLQGDAWKDARIIQFTSANAPLDPRPTSLTVPSGHPSGGLSVALDGLTLVTLWSSGGGASASAIAGAYWSGSSLRPPEPFSPGVLAGAPFAGDARAPVLVGTAAGLVAVWDRVVWRSAGAVADSDVMFARVSRDLTPLHPPVLVSQGTNAEGEPVVARSPRRLLVAFEDHRRDPTGADIFAAPLSLDGQPTGAPPAAVATGPARQTAPAVAWDGANFVVTWSEGPGGLFAARVSEDGALIDAAPVAIKDTAGATLLSEPAVCGDGDGSLLVYSVRRVGSSAMDPARATALRARRIPRGAPPDQGEDVLLTTTADTQEASVLRMACNDKAALVAFTGILAPGDPPRLMLARLERGQTIIARIPGIHRLPHRLTAEWAGVGTDGEGFMVNWRAPNRMGQRVMWATRLDGEGYLLDEQPWPIAPANSGRRVSTTWDGEQYVILSVDTNGVDPFDLVGRRVAKSGALSETSWFKVATLTKPFAGAGLGADAVAVGPGRLFVTYEQYDDEDGAGNPRARGRILITPKGSPIDAAPVEPTFRDGGPRSDATLDSRDGPDEDARDAGADAARTNVRDSGGCGCEVGTARAPGGGAGVAVIAMMAAVVARRPRRQGWPEKRITSPRFGGERSERAPASSG